MQASEIEAVGRLAGEALAAGGNLVREMHAGIAERPFDILGQPARPVRLVHDAVAGAVYAGVCGTLKTAAIGAAKLAAARAALPAPDAGAPVAGHARGATALGILNGLYGDHLTLQGSELALAMEVRRRGRRVPLSPYDLRFAFPDATSRVVVFMHGLCETDEAWGLTPRGGERGGRTYGERLQDELSFTPVHVRYNSGLGISDNGLILAGLLESLTRCWPVPVAELALVGHATGGLICRSACHSGEREEMRFVDLVRHVFCLGAPRLSAGLEQGVNMLAWALRQLPETRAVAGVLGARSVGIKDLRHGAAAGQDWRVEDPDDFLRDRGQEVPFLPDANYYFIGPSLRRGPFGKLLGDLLVRSPDAPGGGAGRGLSIPFEVDNYYELSGINHFELLNHPAVYAQLRQWLMRPVARPKGLLPWAAGAPEPRPRALARARTKLSSTYRRRS